MIPISCYVPSSATKKRTYISTAQNPSLPSYLLQHQRIVQVCNKCYARFIFSALCVVIYNIVNCKSYMHVVGFLKNILIYILIKNNNACTCTF